MRMQTARCLGATKKAILALKNYYQSELSSISALSPDQQRNLAFPYPSQYVSVDGTTIVAFKYTSQLHKDKLVFSSIAGGNKICIKFVRRYSKDVHLKCSTLGFAPALRGYDAFPGGWYMVVMDFIDKFFHELADSPFKASYEEEIREKVAILHQMGFVHGDIRTANTMFSRNDVGRL